MALSILLLLFLLPVALASSHLRLHHRIIHPATQPPPFSERGELHLTGSGPYTSASLVHSQTLPSDLLQFAQSLNHESLQHALYQVALQRPGVDDQSRWDLSSVKACHLYHATSESITIHTTADGSPFAIDYFLGPVPHDGSCQIKPRSRNSSPGSLEFNPISNTTILVNSPTLPPLPQLRSPPPLTQEGNPVEVVPEKSFLQKYWIYIVVAIAALALSPAPPEEEGGGRQGGSQK